MKKILLVCNAGMSTSMLVAKMKKAAEAKEIDVSIEPNHSLKQSTRSQKWILCCLDRRSAMN